MKQLLFILSLICLLALACSNAIQEKANNNDSQLNQLHNSDNPSSDEIIAENLDHHKTVEFVDATESNKNVSPKPITKPVKPVINQTQLSNEKSNNKIAIEEYQNNTGQTINNGNTDDNTNNDVSISISESDVIQPETKKALSHDIFDDLLGKYVNGNGGVDYNAFLKSKLILNDYLTLLKNNPPQTSWSNNKEIAYWINMYNAVTIYSILDKYPISSIMDLEGGKVWDKKKIVIAGKELTLNIIEKDKLLKRFKEPRIHFAVNCAAASCPPLLNKAWTEENVQSYLYKQTKAFINNKKYNYLSSGSIEVSQIFNWYSGDFGGSDKVVNFIQKYADIEVQNDASVGFKEYNWQLNKK
ncbi:MAG: DUF547 domain-containing protein [Saprospiraceae bacterium]|nr:DUF547 domain-containing protein [Saprospiraceae bacterium]